jgi:hypothetical protein
MADQSITDVNTSELAQSTLCLLVQAMHDEISRHKWLESEKAGRDIGYHLARTDWMVRHYPKWLRHWRPGCLP